MSKIRKALQQLQATGGPPAHSQATSVDNGARVAAIAVGRKAEASGVVENAHGVVIEIDHTALRDAGLIAPEYHEQILADQFRDIKRPLIANVFGSESLKSKTAT